MHSSSTTCHNNTLMPTPHAASLSPCPILGALIANVGRAGAWRSPGARWVTACSPLPLSWALTSGCPSALLPALPTSLAIRAPALS